MTNKDSLIPEIPEDSIVPPKSKNPSPSEGLENFHQEDSLREAIMEIIYNPFGFPNSMV